MPKVYQENYENQTKKPQKPTLSLDTQLVHITNNFIGTSFGSFLPYADLPHHLQIRKKAGGGRGGVCDKTNVCLLQCSWPIRDPFSFQGKQV